MPPWSLERRAAQEKNGKFYFTGISCKHGHIANRRVSDRVCVKCSNIKSAAWRKRKLAEDPEFKKKIAAWKHAEFKRHPEKYRAHALKFKESRTTEYWITKRAASHGLTFTQFMDLYFACQGKCWICGKYCPMRGKGCICIDHCHKTKIVRGLLCGQCNKTIGQFKDSPALLRQAIDYLEWRKDWRDLGKPEQNKIIETAQA